MMALTERMLDNTRIAIGKKMAAQSLPATGTDLRDNTQFLSDELTASPPRASETAAGDL